MPLAATFGLHWYGPGLGSMVIGAGLAALEPQPRGRGRAGAVLVADVEVAKARGVPLRRANLALAADVEVAAAAPKARGRARLLLGATGLSAPDVTGAVLEAEVEPGLTLKQALRLMAAALAGKSSGSGATVTFRNPGDTLDRIVATVTAEGARTAVVTDLSDG